MLKSGYLLAWAAGHPDANLGYPRLLPALEGSVVCAIFCMQAHKLFLGRVRAAGYPGPKWVMNH